MVRLTSPPADPRGHALRIVGTRAPRHSRAPERATPVAIPIGSRPQRQPRERKDVKLVIGIVRPEQANQVLEALHRAEVRGFSMSRVQGHGGEVERVETYRGTTVQMGLSEKVRFEVAVSDSC